MSKRKKCISIIIFFLFIAAGISKAEPTPTVLYLMKTPVSMLDYGIYRLDRFLRDESKKLINAKDEPEIGVTYNYDSNRIEIKFLYVIKAELSKGYNIKEEITWLIRKIKESYFGYDHKTGKPYKISKPGGSVMRRFFSHQGYEFKSKPKNLVQELEKITEIYVHVNYQDQLTKGKSPLIGNKIYWEK
jgi:hypothetical protein